MTSWRKITSDIAELYEKYYNQDIRHVEWVPFIICTGCLFKLNQWNKTGTATPFGIPTIWTNPQEHNPAECYACLNFVSSTNRFKTGSLKYTGTRYAQLPLPHSDRNKPNRRIYAETKGESAVSMYQPSNVTPNCNHIEITSPETIAAAINYLSKRFETRILNGPDIRRLMKDQAFENALGDLELVVWGCVKA
ncbi:hypothetical protein ILUMI_15876, partial [Ignelater luminosus]